MSRDRTKTIVVFLKAHTTMDEETARYVVDLIIDQAVEEARNQRKGLDGDNRRKSTAVPETPRSKKA